MDGQGSLVTEALQAFEPAANQLYSLDAAAYLAGVSGRTFLLYCREGSVGSIFESEYGSLMFTPEAVWSVRRAEALRQSHGMDVAGVKLVFGLLDEVESLRRELRFLRGT